MKWIVFSLVIFFYSPVCWTFEFTRDFKSGFYWGAFPIKTTRFAIDEQAGRLLKEVTEQAEAEWENAVGMDIWDFSGDVVLGTTYTPNNIRWSEHFAADTGFDPLFTLAVTIRYSQGTHVVRTEIILNGEMPSLKQNIDNKLYKTVLHELGHTIGLDHSDKPAIMSAFISQIDRLQEDDQAGINAVVDETLQRQASGFRSPLLADEESNALGSSCGQIEDDPTARPGGGFMFSMILGILVTFLTKRRRLV